MALRGIANQANTSTSASLVISVSSIGIESGDLVLLFVNDGGGSGGAVFTYPAGFNPVSTLTNGATAGTTIGVAYKFAGSEPASYTVTSTHTDFFSGQCRVYSGRNTVNPFTAVSQTPQTALSGGSPFNLPLNQLATANSDDVVCFVGFDNSSINNGQTFSVGGPAGFANASTAPATAGAQFQSVMGGFDQTNTLGGVTGTIVGNLIATTNPGSFAGYVISMTSVKGPQFWPSQVIAVPQSQPFKLTGPTLFDPRAFVIPIVATAANTGVPGFTTWGRHFNHSRHRRN